MALKKLGLVVLVVSLGWVTDRAGGVGADNVLVLYNADSAEGSAIATFYSQARPGVHLLALQNTPTAEVVSARTYLDTIRPQVLAALSDDIDYIVTTKGLPLRIDNPGSGPGWSRFSSLESELTRVDTFTTTDKMGNQAFFWPELWGGNPDSQNPYFGQERDFSYLEYGIRLVTRLDGFSVADVQASIDRARRALLGRAGQIVFMDDRPGRNDRMEDLAVLTAQRLGPDATYYDGTDDYIRQADGPVLAYVGHGTHGNAPLGYLVPGEPDALSITPVDGAVFHTYESYNAYTFNYTGLGDSNTLSPKGQGLLAQWIAMGGTAGVGHVEEPYNTELEYITNEDRMFQMLLDGYTWAEAAWSATYQVSFVTTIVGDPLMVFQEVMLGDVNGDGIADNADITPAVYAFTHSEDEFYLTYPDGQYWAADGTQDGKVDNLDITPFINVLSGGGSVIPEPATLSLLALSACLLVKGRRGSALARRRKRRF